MPVLVPGVGCADCQPLSSLPDLLAEKRANHELSSAEVKHMYTNMHTTHNMYLFPHLQHQLREEEEEVLGAGWPPRFGLEDLVGQGRQRGAPFPDEGATCVAGEEASWG